MLSAPQLLIAFRAACAPAIFVLACFGFPGPLLAAILCAAFLSDVFDGIIARRLGVATAALRHADTLADTVFYIAAAVALRIAVPDAFDGAGVPLVLLIAIHVSRTTFELAKYGRVASYHMWSSKALGILLLATMTTVFVTARPNALMAVTLWAGIANELEGFAASVILPRWRVNVPTLLHAWALSRPSPCGTATTRLPRSQTDGASAALASFLAEHAGGIQRRGTARRQVRRERADREHAGRHQDQRPRIGGRDAERQTREQS